MVSTTSTTPTRRRSRLLRFSLRSLFVATAVIGVLLAVYVVPAERQRRAIAEIRAAGGEVHYDYDEGLNASPPDWRRRWLGIDYVGNPVRVWLPKGASEAQVRYASEWKNLEVLYLREVALTDPQLSLFANHTKLVYLYLDSTNVTSVGLASLTNMKALTMLTLANTQIGDQGLSHLRSLDNLRSLTLSETGITDLGIRHLAEIPNLATLDISNTRVTDAGLRELHSCKTLNGLDLTGSDVTYAGVSRLQDALPNCGMNYSYRTGGE